jgi:hypothetical protein
MAAKDEEIRVVRAKNDILTHENAMLKKECEADMNESAVESTARSAASACQEDPNAFTVTGAELVSNSLRVMQSKWSGFPDHSLVMKIHASPIAPTAITDRLEYKVSMRCISDSWAEDKVYTPEAALYIDRFGVITAPIEHFGKLAAPTTAELVLVYADDPTRVVEAAAFGKDAIFVYSTSGGSASVMRTDILEQRQKVTRADRMVCQIKHRQLQKGQYEDSKRMGDDCLFHFRFAHGILSRSAGNSRFRLRIRLGYNEAEWSANEALKFRNECGDLCTHQIPGVLSSSFVIQSNGCNTHRNKQTIRNVKFVPDTLNTRKAPEGAENHTEITQAMPCTQATTTTHTSRIKPVQDCLSSFCTFVRAGYRVVRKRSRKAIGYYTDVHGELVARKKK